MSSNDTDAERKEFEQAWGDLLARLTPEQQELLTTVITGAEVNYSAVYMLVCTLVGVGIGWALAGLGG